MTNPFQIKWDIIPTVSGWVVNIEKGFLMRVELVHNNIADRFYYSVSSQELYYMIIIVDFNG